MAGSGDWTAEAGFLAALQGNYSEQSMEKILGDGFSKPELQTIPRTPGAFWTDNGPEHVRSVARLVRGEKLPPRVVVLGRFRTNPSCEPTASRPRVIELDCRPVQDEEMSPREQWDAQTLGRRPVSFDVSGDGLPTRSFHYSNACGRSAARALAQAVKFYVALGVAPTHVLVDKGVPYWTLAFASQCRKLGLTLAVGTPAALRFSRDR